MSNEPTLVGDSHIDLDEAIALLLSDGTVEDLGRAADQLQAALAQRGHALSLQIGHDPRSLGEIYLSASWYQTAVSLGAVQVALLLVTSRRMQFEPPAPQAF